LHVAEGHLRIALFGLASIVFIGAIVALVGPLLISTDDLRDALLAQVESATGYRLRLSGPVNVALVPSLDLVAKDVGVGWGGAKAPELATASSLRFGLRLSALFGGTFEVTDVTLVDPVIALPRARNAATADAKRTAEPRQEAGSAVAVLRALSLDRFRIENGTLILPSSGDAPGKRIEAIAFEASLPAIDAPLAFEASATIDGNEMQAAGSIGELGRLLDGAAVPVALKLDAPAYVGEEARLDAVATYSGKSFALSQFTAMAGEKSLTGSATYKGGLLTLHPLTLNAGGNRLSGSVAADLSGPVPAINAAFSGQALNLDTLLATPGAPEGYAEKRRAVGWSDKRIDFTALRAVTAKLKLSAGQLTYHGIKIAQANLQATIAGGKLAAGVPNFKLYDGAGTLNVNIDANGKSPSQRIRLSLVNLNAQPFLNDAAGFDSIEGTGAISLDLVASGSTERAMVAGLGGAAKFEFTDGAIRGINIAKTLRRVGTGILSGWQENEAEKTDFATFGASFKIAKGRADTTDLRLVGPLVRMAGTGSVDLPAQSLTFRVDPKLVASLEGQGGKADLQGLGVKVAISGPWANPSIYPDIEGILTDPVAAYEQLDRLGGGLVSLPGAAGAGTDSGIGALIENGALAPDAVESGAITGIGQLLDAEPPADAASPRPESGGKQQATEKVVTPAKAGKKKKEARAKPASKPDAMADQALQSFFGN
jgi:AsmA protein